MSQFGRPPPKPEEVFVVPPAVLSALRTITSKMKGSEAKWSVIGDLSENLQGVHVRPNEIEILTDEDGLKQMFNVLLEYKPTEITLVERTLDRTAEIQEKTLPVLVRSNCTSLAIQGVQVRIDSEYQMKVGDWEWGDPLVFDPVSMNVAGMSLSAMPLRLASEFYLTLGWLDRVEGISDAVARAHHLLHQSGGEPVY